MSGPAGRILLEACVDSVASAVAADAGGADRLELCDNLVEGGTTPSAGMIARCVERVAIPVFVMIRPRGGDFLYDPDELLVMERDIRVAADAGAAGVVFGALTPDGTIDADVIRRLTVGARPLSVTVHRAFDLTRDLHRSLDVLLELNIDRVLTSGGAPSAVEGAGTIAQLVAAGGGRIAVMAGGGVRPSNVGDLVRRTGVREVHARLTQSVPSEMRFRSGGGVSRPGAPDEHARAVTSREAVSEMVAVLRAPHADHARHE